MSVWRLVSNVYCLCLCLLTVSIDCVCQCLSDYTHCSCITPFSSVTCGTEPLPCQTKYWSSHLFFIHLLFAWAHWCIRQTEYMLPWECVLTGYKSHPHPTKWSYNELRQQPAAPNHVEPNFEPTIITPPFCYIITHSTISSCRCYVNCSLHLIGNAIGMHCSLITWYENCHWAYLRKPIMVCLAAGAPFHPLKWGHSDMHADCQDTTHDGILQSDWPTAVYSVTWPDTGHITGTSLLPCEFKIPTLM